MTLCQKIDGFWVRIQIGRFITLGNFSKPVAIIILPKLPTFLGNFCMVVEIFHPSSEILFGQLLKTFGDFLLVISSK